MCPNPKLTRAVDDKLRSVLAHIIPGRALRRSSKLVLLPEFARSTKTQLANDAIAFEKAPCVQTRFYKIACTMGHLMTFRNTSVTGRAPVGI